MTEIIQKEIDDVNKEIDVFQKQIDALEIKIIELQYKKDTVGLVNNFLNDYDNEQYIAVFVDSPLGHFLSYPKGDKDLLKKVKKINKMKKFNCMISLNLCTEVIYDENDDKVLQRIYANSYKFHGDEAKKININKIDRIYLLQEGMEDYLFKDKYDIQDDDEIYETECIVFKNKRK